MRPLTDFNQRWSFGIFRCAGTPSLPGSAGLAPLADPQHRRPWRVPRPDPLSFWISYSFWYYTRADQNRFIDRPVRFQANRLKNFFPTEWHREDQIVYVKADLLKVAGRVPGGVAI